MTTRSRDNLPVELIPLGETYFLAGDREKAPVRFRPFGEPIQIMGLPIRCSYLDFLVACDTERPEETNAFVRGGALAGVEDKKSYSFCVQYGKISKANYRRGLALEQQGPIDDDRFTFPIKRWLPSE